MESMATTSPSSAPAQLRNLRRDPHNGYVAGVCEGVGRGLGIDPLLLRIAFGAATFASGIGIVAYVLAWLMLPAPAVNGPAKARARWGGTGTVQVAAGAGFLLLSVLLTLRELGLPFSDLLIWPLVLAAAGGALLWRHSIAATPSAPPTPRLEAPARSDPASLTSAESRPAVISRVGIGVTLVVAAAIVFLQLSGALAAASDVALAAIVVAIALGVIFAPWFLRMATSLSLERAERIRSQERAEVAAHLHDSVLQTLALVQRRAGNPREVAALARRQERELRSWLSGRPGAEAGEHGLAGALEKAAEEIEEAHGVAVDVVAVGDVKLDRDGTALVAAAREAMLNAAKFGDGSAVAVYAEAGDGRLQVFVRDRGPGFDPAAIPADRRGVRESIVGRMERHGGRAAINASPGGGTEVELVLDLGETT